MQGVSEMDEGNLQLKLSSTSHQAELSLIRLVLRGSQQGYGVLDHHGRERNETCCRKDIGKHFV